MFKFLTLISLLWLFPYPIKSQTNNITPLDHLFGLDRPIPGIHWDGRAAIETTDPVFSNFPQQIVKNKSGLFIAINGSGRLYKVEKNGFPVSFRRLDSTIYFGSNFGSYIFSHNDTIFSLGGYGFWKTNGLLRYYIPSRHEWEVTKLNREIPVLTGNVYDLIWHDIFDNKLYFGFTREENNNTKERKPENNLNHECLALDLHEKEWINLGQLSDFLKSRLINIRNIASTPYGQMIAIPGKNLFLNYSTNQIFALTEKKQKQLEELPTVTGDTHTQYFTDSTFYCWLTSKNLVDSIRITPADLILLEEKIFVPQTKMEAATGFKLSHHNYTIFFTLALLLGIIIFIVKKRKAAISIDKESKPGFQDTINNSFINYTSVELDLIQILFDNSTKGSYSNTDDINKILGVSKKNTEIQKKQRSETITSINRKFMFTSQSSQELIEKKRAAFDKRSYEYFIDSSRLQFAKNILDSIERHS